MALSYVQLIDKIEANLQDSANTVFVAASDVTYGLQDALRELSKYRPHVELDVYTVESRTGTASSTLASHLVDATKAQFTAADVGKVVYNSTDKTYAIITAYTSTSDVTLNANIMASGENYKLFNPNCTNAKQIDIASSLDDYLAIKEVQFPIGTPRNWSLIGTILELDLVSDPSDTSSTSADKTVYIYVERNHYVSNLTDFAAAVNLLAGYSAGSTSIILDALQSSGTIRSGQEFTIASCPGIYRVTADATIATNAATVTFFPGLQAAVLDNAVVTFKQTTLTPQLESVVCDLAAAYAAINKPLTGLNAFAAEDFWTNVTTGLTGTATQITAASSALTAGLALIAAQEAAAATAIGVALTASALARTDMAAGRSIIVTNKATATTAITAAATAIGLGVTALASGAALTVDKRDEAVTAIGIATTELAQAVTDAASGRALAITNKTAAGTALTAAGTAVGLGVTALNSGNALIVDQRDEALTAIGLMTDGLLDARADIASARALFNTVNVGSPETHYLQAAGTEVNGAVGYLNEAKGYLTDVLNVPGSYRQQAQANLQIAATDIASAKAYMDLDAAANIQYLRSASQEVQNAVGKLQEANANLNVDSVTSANYVRQAAGDVQIALSKFNEARAYMDLDRGYNTQYLQSASAEIQAAHEKLSEVQALLAIEQAGVAEYQNQAVSQLKIAQGNLEQSAGYIRRFNAKAAYQKTVQFYQVWGERKLAMVTARLQSLQHGPRILKRHSSE